MVGRKTIKYDLKTNQGARELSEGKYVLIIFDVNTLNIILPNNFVSKNVFILALDVQHAKNFLFKIFIS